MASKKDQRHHSLIELPRANINRGCCYCRFSPPPASIVAPLIPPGYSRNAPLTRPVEIPPTCAQAAREMTWLEAIRNQCPRAAAELGRLMGAAELSHVFRALGLTSAPSIPIRTAEAVDTPIEDVGRAALGQDTLTVSPLQIALAYGALASGGELPALQLVDAVESMSGRWVQNEPLVPDGLAVQAFTSASASLVRRSLPLAEEIAGITVPVLSAADGQANQWYVGFAPNDQPRYIALVVLEQPDDVNLAEQIGEQILNQAMLQP